MSMPSIILTQVAISVAVVAVYHLWVSRRKQPAPLPQPVLVAPPVVVAPVATPAKIPPVAEQLPSEIIAVIAAAVAVVLGRPHRVVSVEQAAAQTREVNVWALEGRVEQFMSHKVR